MNENVKKLQDWFNELPRTEQQAVLEFLYGNVLETKGLYCGPAPGTITSTKGLYVGPAPTTSETDPKKK